MKIAEVSITSNGSKIDSTYDVLSVEIITEVNRVPSAQIILLEGREKLHPFPISEDADFEPGKKLVVTLSYLSHPGKRAYEFKGVVVAQRIEAGPGGLQLTIDLKDAAVKMTATRKSMVYKDQTDSQIIGKIIHQSGLSKGKIPTTKAKHGQLVQYACTDWDFMLMRAEANGLLTVVENGVLSLPEIEVGGAAKHSFTYDIDAILSFEFEVDASRQVVGVESTAWDVKKQTQAAGAKAEALKLSQSDLDGQKIAKAIGFDPCMLNAAVTLLPDELKAWSTGTLARNRLAFIRGRLSVEGLPDLELLNMVEVKGISKRVDGKALVTGIRHRYEHMGWTTDMQFGLSPQRFAHEADIAEIPASGLLPAVNGLQVGVVSAIVDDPDKEMRVQVKLSVMEDKEAVIWARVASPDAGHERGYFFCPEKGDEVVVGFFNNDPRQAVILGAMFGSKNNQPKGIAKVTDKNIEKGFVTKKGTSIKFIDKDKPSLMIETPGKNSILIDDDAQKIELKDQHGNTITMSKDGIVIKSAKDIKIEAQANVEIKGAKIDIK